MRCFYIVCVAFWSITVYAQEFARGYEVAEIHFNNGDVKTGFIYDDFAQSNGYGKLEVFSGYWYQDEMYNVGIGFKSSTFQTIIKTIHYKVKRNDEQVTDYKTDEIDFITVKRARGTAITKYKTLKVKRVEKENDVLRIDTLQRTIWAPVLKEGKISMYGYLTWEQSEKFYWGEVYFKREDDEYAINMIKSNKVVFGLGPQKQEIAYAIKDIFRDCPDMVNNADALTEAYIEDLHYRRSLTAEDRKEIKTHDKDDQNMVRFIIREKKCFIPYFTLMDKYTTACP